jgi:hypothetical protein
MLKLFISYSRKDLGFAEQLSQSLSALGHDVWLDKGEIEVGENFPQAISDGIDSAAVFLFIISPDSVASEWCNREIQLAKQHSKRIIPILYRDVEEIDVFARLVDKPWGAEARSNWENTISVINWAIFRKTLINADAALFQERLLQLDQAVRIDLVFNKEHARLLERARQWQLQNQAVDYLLDGDESEAAEAFQLDATQKLRSVALLVTRYIQESQRYEAKKRRETRQRWILVGGIGVALLLILGAAGWVARENDIRAGISEFYNQVNSADTLFNLSNRLSWQRAALMYCGALQRKDLTRSYPLSASADLLTTIPCPNEVSAYLPDSANITRTFGQLGRACLNIKNYPCAETVFKDILNTPPQGLTSAEVEGYTTNYILTLIGQGTSQSLQAAQPRIDQYVAQYPQSRCGGIRLQAKFTHAQAEWSATLTTLNRLTLAEIEGCSPYGEELAFMRLESLQRTSADCSDLRQAWISYEALWAKVKAVGNRPSLGGLDRESAAIPLKSEFVQRCG